MSPILNPQAEQQAIYWQAKLSSDLVTEHEHLEFAAWLSRSTENKLAWQSINQFWTGLDSVSLADISDETSGHILAFNPKITVKTQRTYFKTHLALAASVFLMVNVAYTQLDFYLADFHSVAGQQQLITLEDGSTILLNTSSAVSVDFSEQQRLITLHQGEGYFKVAADSKRPFIVKTHAGQVQALGTAFDVKHHEQEVSVIVFEHAVKITTAMGQVQEKLLEAEQIDFSSDGFKSPRHTNLQRASAWHDQLMVFQDKPLSEVVEELDRYRQGKILIVGEPIKNLTISGVFGIADTEIALKTIEQSLPVKVRKFTDNLVLISAK